MLNYLALKCENVTECLTFYTTLGFAFAPETHERVPLHYAASLGGFTLELHGAAARGEFTGGGTRLGLAVADVQTVTEAAEAAGAEVQQHPKRGPWGLRAVLIDPDGRRVELTAAPE